MLKTLGKRGHMLNSRFGGYRLDPARMTGIFDVSRGATNLVVITVNSLGDGIIVTTDASGWYVAQMAIIGGFFAASTLTSPEFRATSPTAITVGQRYVVVARSTQTAVSLFIDGVKVAETAGTMGNPDLKRDVYYNNNTVDNGTSLECGLSFNSALTDNEIRYLSNNPWQVFEGAQRTLVIPDASVALPTLAYPSATNSAGAWISTAATLHGAINEPTTPNDASYISVSSGSVCDFTLDNTAFPCGANVELKTRGSSTSGATLTVRLYQGATTIMTRAIVLTATDTTYTHTLTAPEIALIVAGAISGTLTTS